MNKKWIVPIWGVAALAVSLWFLIPLLDLSLLSAVWAEATRSPVALGLVLTLYLSAFLIRALLWTRVLPGLSFKHSLAALHVSLAGNHVLPLRLGEALRVSSVVQRAGVRFAPATASTVMLRAADILAVGTLATALGPRVVGSVVGSHSWLLIVPPALLWAGGMIWLARLKQQGKVQVRLPLVSLFLMSTGAWVLESAVVWQAASWAGISLSPLDAVLVTAVTIAAQVVAITPGGIGTYEAAATASLVTVGAPPEAALAAAVTAHAIKTAYSLVAGGIGLFVPAPGALGRLRLSPPSTTRSGSISAGDGGVVLFLPAFNEEDAIEAVVARVPRTVCDRPVTCLVIDDGSTDRTAERARAAGAEVVSLGGNHGLGAAVRAGFSEGVTRGAAVVAFCDADGEYAPEELENLVAPILKGKAGYVVGSRFAGHIEHMLPHRRLGNTVLTKLMRFISRQPISDGQSGYRALSREAAAAAELVHDFNYAQVLTLDLLDKGFGYLEVPISYRFREHGKSFVKLGSYLRHVAPAVYRELNPQRGMFSLKTRPKRAVGSSFVSR